ncbi:hypothetical protein D9758_000662 [Tetrapyrgos nigripes]|uniref:Uncharacterized protein n=1 Tax=Tetrapyrgos nigripes TaxID=182062 RepID=A0A8H5GYR8_9AGAR|nr:hypothetical protein D9758_000662 [Tetrapyrgos nigripes]
MYDYVFEGSMLFLENGPYAIIPNEFLRRWKQWLDKPTEAMRPESIDNEQFFCEHQKLCIDPNNPSDFSTAAIIKRQEWDVLCTLYSGGPLIALDRYLGADTDEPKFFYEPPICEGCRTKRKLNWDATAITVCLLNGNASAVPKNGHSATHLRNNGTRQSRRLRQVRENGEKRRLNVTRSTTVKEIKVMIQEEFNIPTICQGLYYDNVELDDNSATMGSLSILANSLLTLREIREVEEISDSEDNTVRKREREEGQGFGGTLLSSQNLSTGSVAQEKSCDKCTFSNPLDRLACDMCDTIFV